MITVAQKVRIELLDRDVVISDQILMRQIIIIKGKQMMVELIMFKMIDFA